jgi:hypothetical protein
MTDDGRTALFDTLRSLLARYAAHLVITADQPGNYSLDTEHIQGNHKPLYFGGVAVRRNAVHFYLMPIYVFPDLLTGISPTLRARMQGKSCFTFRTEEPTLFAELGRLTEAGFARFQAEGLLG